MTRVILDATLQQKLHGLTQELELCDKSGTVLARLIPVIDEPQYAEEPFLSREELDRRLKEPDFTTAEVLKYLESL